MFKKTQETYIILFSMVFLGMSFSVGVGYHLWSEGMTYQLLTITFFVLCVIIAVLYYYNHPIGYYGSMLTLAFFELMFVMQLLSLKSIDDLLEQFY